MLGVSAMGGRFVSGISSGAQGFRRRASGAYQAAGARMRGSSSGAAAEQLTFDLGSAMAGPRRFSRAGMAQGGRNVRGFAGRHPFATGGALGAGGMYLGTRRSSGSNGLQGRSMGGSPYYY